MSLLKCILVAIFSVVLFQWNAYTHSIRNDKKQLSHQNDERSKNDHKRDNLDGDKINNLGQYHNNRERLNEDDYVVAPDEASYNDEFTESTSEQYYEETTLGYETESDTLNECILSRAQFYLSWWVFENGSLRVPPNVRLNSSGILDLSLSFSTEEAIFNHVLNVTSDNPSNVIRFMSIASNMLNNIPTSTLNLTAHSLQYLSLAGNDFHYVFEQYNTTFQEFSAFPLMTTLKELDLRNCQIAVLQYDYFKNLPTLEKLFLSHNRLHELKHEAIAPLINLRHLDLSYNYFYDEPLSFLFDGIVLDAELFTNLKRLMFLDMSHTKISNDSMKALASLQHEIEQVSLCYTGITTLIPGMFKGRSVKVLDLSGNSGLLNNLQPEHLSGLENLEILVIRNASVNDISLISSLVRLRMLDLKHNQITYLSASNFTTLTELEIIDFDYNHIYNWNRSIFASNEKLKILNMRSNKITIIAQEMLRDFYLTRFLAVGNNEFICACNLRDFIDRAAWNARYQFCRQRRQKRDVDISAWQSFECTHCYDVFLREYHIFLNFYEDSYRNILANNFANAEIVQSYYLNFASFTSDDCYEFENETIVNGMNFDFLLLDYNENDYKCTEYYDGEHGKSKRIVHFYEVESCFNGEETTSGQSTTDEESNEEPTDGTEPPLFTTTPSLPRNLKKFELMYLYFLLGIPIMLIALFWYWKRADIKYFFSIFKNSIILSLDKDDKKALMMTNRKRKSNADNFIYDVFVSYSDKDRPWVLDEFIPNIEKRTEINICLHERDFQVGMSILENIIQCMDKSRCLLLVVSEAFLKSNWCSFEMHLAQHRLIETRREQLILVLLQDIPRSKRSRTLQFLMRTKTYIMWPQDNKPESYATFWKRLKKAIILNNWEVERKSQTKPRHSIV